jgi:hypothetical protein
MAERKLLRLDWEKELPKAEKPQYDPAKQVEGYQKRIAGAGQDPEAAVDTRNFVEKALNLTENQNALFDVFEIINRPQQAVFGGIEAAQKGTSVGEGIMKGLTGETDIRATELLQNAGFQKNLGTDAVGFLLDVFADPVDLALIPVTGGLSLAANLTDGAADAAKAIKVIGKYSDEAAEIAFDVVQKNAKGLKVKFSNLDEFKTVLKKYDIGADEYLLNLAKSVKQFVSPIDVTFGAVGKGFKAGLNGVDSLITSTLKFVDDAIPTVPKLADEARGLVKELTRVDRYTNFKKSISNIISYVGALPQRLKFKSKLAQGGAELTANKLVYVEKEVIQQLDNYVAKQIKFNPLYKGLNVESARVLAGKQLQLKAEIAGKFDPQTTIESFLEKGNARVPRDVDTNVKADLINFFEDMLPDVYDRKTLERMFEKTPTQDNMFFINEDQWAGLIDEYKKSFSRLPVTRASAEISNVPNLIKKYEFNPFDTTAQRNLKPGQKIGNKYDTVQEALDNVNDSAVVYGKNADKYNIDKTLMDKEFQGLSVKNGKIIDADQTRGFQTALDKTKRTELVFKNPTDLRKTIENNKLQNYGIWKKKATGEYVLDTTSRYFDDEKVARDLVILANQDEGFIYGTYGALLPDAARAKDIKAAKPAAYKAPIKAATETAARDFGAKTDVLGLRPTETRYIKQGRLKSQEQVKQITKERLTASRYFTQGEYERISRLAEDPDFVALEKSIDDLYRDAANIMDEHGLKFRGEMYDRGIIPHARTVEYDEFGELPSKIASDYNKVKGNSRAFGAREFNMSATEANLVSEQRILRLKEKGLLSDEMLKAMDEKGIPKLFAEDMQRSLSELIIKGPELQKNVEMLSELVMKDALSDDLLLKSAIPDEFGRIKEPPGFRLITKAQLEKQIKGLGKYMAGDGPMQKAIEVLADKGDNLLIDARVANLIMTISNPKTANILLDVIDKSNNLFKTGKLMTPGLLMRNFGGNVTNVVLSGVPINVVLKERVYAMEVLNKGQELLEASVRKTRILTSQETDMLKLYQEFIENGFNKMSYDRIDIPPIMRDILNKPLNQRNKWEQAVGFFAEKNVQDDLIHRMGAYIIAKKNPKYYLSLGITNPADYVRSVLFDPNDLSRFEQNVLKRIIPFYTWTKQNLVYQMKNFSRRPGAYYRTAKMFDGAWELKGIDPTTDIEDYKRENFWLPVPVLGKNGKYYAVKMNLPLADLGEFISNPLGRVLSATAPVIRAPFEIATNTQVMTGLPVQDFKGQAGYSIPGMPRNIEYGLGQLGLDVPLGAGVRTAQAIGGLATGKMGLTEAAENTILKSIVSPGDVARTQRSRAYDKLNKVRETMKFFKQEGIEIPTIAELENKAKQNMYNRIKGQLAKYK